jgi:tRNA A-37 threonylcarbamoyl transferase component Bud32
MEDYGAPPEAAEQHTETSPSARRTPRATGAATLAAGAMLGGRFRLVRLLGRGGSGAVWAAVDTAVGQRVAVKVLHPDLDDERTRERLRREVRAARPGHPNLVTVYDLHEDTGAVFLSMELVEGESLRERLAARGRLAVEEVVAVGRQVAAALVHLHAKGLVHRDVKPGNVLVAADGAVKLCDMGLTRLVEQGTTVTETEVVVGTPAFMAPEQGAGRELSAAADVYSLGLSLYCCLTGEVPFQEASAVATLMRRQRERPPCVRRLRPDCPHWLERLIRHMLEPEPRQRPAASRVVRALESGRVLPRLRRGTLVCLAAGALVAVSAVAGVVEWRAKRTVGVELGEREVRGVDSRGQATWSYTLESPIRQVERADLDRDGADELVVVAFPDLSERPPATPSEVLILTQQGRVVSRQRPEDLVTQWEHPYAKRLEPRAKLLDLDGDGGQEVVLICRHPAFYPCEMVLYWPRWAAWRWVLDHAGWIYDVAAVPGSSPPAVRFLAVNNRLAMLPVVGELAARTPGEPTASLAAMRALWVAEGGVPEAATATLTMYVPCWPASPDATQTQSLSVLPDGGTRAIAGGELILDPLGNPIPGPNAGRDLRTLRLALLVDLYDLSVTSRTSGRDLVVERVAALDRRMAPLLAELPYRAIVDLAASRGLAQAGEAAAARVRLERALAAAPFDEVAYRLAHLEAVAGDLGAAIARLSRLAERTETRRGCYDAPQLLIRLAIERRDARLLASAAEVLRANGVGMGSQVGLVSSISARADLWWDVVREPDLAVRSWPYAPDGDAVACLARWRSGRTRPDDAERMQKVVEEWPEARAEVEIALAAAQLALGQANQAVDGLDALLSILQPDARSDFASLQLAQLAGAVRAKALLTSGKPEQARFEAQQLLTTARPGLLPAILAEDVVRTTSPGA